MTASTATRPTLRPAGDASADELGWVFREVRGEPFRAAGVPPAALGPLLDLQFRAQQSQYRVEHPDAEDHLVDLDGQVVGRCWFDRRPGGIRVLDIAVLPGCRRRGIATAVLLGLQQEVGDGCVHLSVWPDDGVARSLYDALGYRLRAKRPDGYLELCRTTGSCSASHPREATRS